MPHLDNLQLLARLIAFDTVSRNSNLPMLDFLADYLDRPGVRVERNPSEDGTKANLIVLAGPPVDPDTREGLLLSGHMDVVPADEPEWESDPFVLTRRGDAVLGRGAADMKGFLALAANRFAAIAPDQLRRPLGLLLTYDEELGTLGAHHFARTWPTPAALPRQVIIGEPTLRRAVRMHKGHLKLRLGFQGQPAHSGYPHLGRNAIEPAARVITALAELRDTLERERPATADLFPDVPFVALNVAMVTGGSAVNVIPDRCTVDVGIRVLPGMRSEDLVERVRQAAHRITADFTLDVLGDSPPFLLEESRPLYRHVCAELGQRTSESVAFATDAGWLQTVGFDCVIWGPGTIAVAHKPNESLPLAELSGADRTLERLVNDACLTGSA